MPARSSSSSAVPTVTAPDGIAIHTFELPAATFVGVAEGRIPPGRFAIHRHLTLEQYTYVTAGELTALAGDAESPWGRVVQLAAGALLLTLPGESLEFINTGRETARVLFICAPPYPADDSDTHVLGAHSPPTVEENRAAITRLEALKGEMNQAIDSRLAALRLAIAEHVPDSA